MIKKISEENQLLEETNHARIALQEAHAKFDYISDEMLIESYIYDIKAKEKRYEYFLRLCREKGIAAYKIS